MTWKSYQKRFPLKKHDRSTKTLHTLLGSEFQGGAYVKESLESTYFIDFYSRMCRGLQLRNWKAVKLQLLAMKCHKNIITVCYHSWVRFKVARALRPHMSSTYVYLLKNCSTLEGQRIYDDVYEQYTEQPYSTTLEFYRARGKDPIYFRLMEYFYNEQPEWILPLTVFPRIDFEKSKMHYSMEPYEIDGDMVKEVQEKVFNYIMSLDIEKLFIPRGELMQKYGSQRYNDGGVVRFDYERPSNSFDSSFKYQRFLTAPLTPREVWLPGKAIKQNNAFFMTVHRQILERDPVYPSLIMEENHEVLKPHLQNGFWKFDISGFGFQFVREWLIAGNNAIRELYPCSQMEEQSEIFEQILNSVDVEMPDGTHVKPVRGIGLGYYEDLKTLVMMALLRDFYPIQVYGDQGLIEKRGIEFCFELMKYSFIMNYEKIDEGASEKRTRWGGIVFDPDSFHRPRLYSDPIFGAFFSRHHWERKSSLYSFSKHYPEIYRGKQKVLADVYKRVFGYEFHDRELSSSFYDGGICIKPREVGVSRLYNIRSYATPMNMMVFDPIYQTPFQLITKNDISFKESKKFQIKRKKLYREQTPQSSYLYDYINPIIEFNKKDRVIRRSLPRWADLSLILETNSSSGALTCGLSGEEIYNAVLYQHFASDPFRARATGGYSFVTTWRSERPPSQEWLEAAELLMKTDSIDSMYVNRTDLVQNPMLMDDEMYKDTNLFSNLVGIVNKRKTAPSVTQSELNTFAEDIRKILPSMIKRNKVSNFSDVIKLTEERLEEYGDNCYNIAESDHGELMDDDLYYADTIDMVDL